MSMFSLSKVRSLFEPPPREMSPSFGRNSDSNGALDSNPDMQMVGGYPHGLSTSRAHIVTRSSSAAPNPFPQQIREHQELRQRDNHRTRKDSSIKTNRPNPPKIVPTMPTPSTYPSEPHQTSTASTINSPIVPTTPVHNLSEINGKLNYFGIPKTSAENAESLTDWETLQPSKASAAAARSSNDVKARSREDHGKRTTESPRRRDPGLSTDDEHTSWKSEKRRMAREVEGLMKEKSQLLSENEQLKQQIAKSQEKMVFTDQTLAEDKQIIEALNLQVTSLKQAHLQASEHAKTADDRVREFERYCEELQSGSEQLEDEARSLRAKVRELDERGGRLEQLRRVEERLQGVEQYCRELQDKNQRLEAESRALKDKTRDAEDRENQLQTLLDVRTSDLKGAKTFLTMEDKFSGADVLKMVEALNAEIFQASAYLAGLVEDVPKEHMKRVKWPQCVSQEAYKTIEKRVGRALMDFIEEKGPDNRRDPLALQLAFQAILVWWSTYMVNNFADGQTGSDIGLLYKYIRETEPQAVSARWRAITSEKLGKLMKPTFTNFITYSIAGILKMGGATFPAGGKNATAIQESILQVEKVWKQIKAAGKEGIISCEVDLAYSDPGTPFDPTTMEDSYHDEGAYSPSDMVGDTVLCPVAVGLKRSWAKRSDNGQSMLQDEVLLKPKVVLSSVFTHIGDFSIVMDEHSIHTTLRELQIDR